MPRNSPRTPLSPYIARITVTIEVTRRFPGAGPARREKVATRGITAVQHTPPATPPATMFAAKPRAPPVGPGISAFISSYTAKYVPICKALRSRPTWAARYHPRNPSRLINSWATSAAGIRLACCTVLKTRNGCRTTVLLIPAKAPAKKSPGAQANPGLGEPGFGGVVDSEPDNPIAAIEQHVWGDARVRTPNNFQHIFSNPPKLLCVLDSHHDGIQWMTYHKSQ
mmetsp:Transcript_9845/g.21409  ORF Transcript_9845/g.21409 Transcript_9845/m.21409 type:complete len:225 (-) Transcript_9845:68-742(-)